MPGIQRRLLPGLQLLLLYACSNPMRLKSADKLADVAVFELNEQDFTHYEFAMDQQDGSYSYPSKTFNKGNKIIKAKVPPGTYEFSLIYYKDKAKIFSSAFCGDPSQAVKSLKAGVNLVDLTVCNEKGEAIVANAIVAEAPAESDQQSIPGSSPGAKPKPTSPDNTPSPSAPSESFSIQNGKLIDRIGKPFIIRGINVPFAYYFDPSFTALDNVKAQGFNAVRIVWCADNYQDAGLRCQPKDFRPAADLDRVITKIEDLRLVPVFNLQNATGLDTVEPLEAMADYILRADIKAVLLKHKQALIINIANEWMGSWTKSRVWVDGYRNVIRRIRAAGLPHVLVVDARGYGQDFSSIEESAQELLQLDKNLLFSSHMYAVYGTDAIVQEKLNYIRSKQLPFIIGEFGCSHYDDSSGQNNPVACDAILRETASSSYPIGHMAWSYSGNRVQESELDVFNASDWRTPTSYGQRVLTGTYGVKATAKQACFYDPGLCR